MQERIANLKEVEFHNKCRAYEIAYTRTIEHIIDIVERYTWLREQSGIETARELSLDFNEVTEDAVLNGIEDALADLELMTRIENVTSVRV